MLRGLRPGQSDLKDHFLLRFDILVIGEKKLGFIDTVSVE